MTFPTKYMTKEATDLIMSMEGEHSFKEIFEEMVRRGMKVPGNHSKLRERWLKRNPRDKVSSAGIVRKCLMCRCTFHPEFKGYFVCNPCKTTVMWA